MEGIGILNYRPPDDVPSAPILKDGIHLRWSFQRELGFPWHGFYLFRRTHHPGKWQCVQEVLSSLQAGRLTTNRLSTSMGEFSSDRTLLLTDDFAPLGMVEFDLANRGYLRFSLPSGEAARAVLIGIRRRNSAETCIDFRPLSDHLPAPFSHKGTKFEVFNFNGQPESVLGVQSFGGAKGLNCETMTRITLPCLAKHVTLLLSNDARLAVVIILDPNGTPIAKAETQQRGSPEMIHLEGDAIAEVVIECPENEVLLHQFCFLCAEREESQEAEGIAVTALSRSIPVAQTTVNGHAGQIVSATLQADHIDVVEVSAGDAALINVCYIPVSQDATQGWELVPNLELPICLPVAHPDYPCPNAPADFGSAHALADDRIGYDLPAEWQEPDSFSELYKQLLFLVKGGRTGGAMAMRTTTVPVEDNSGEPAQLSMSEQFPLDPVLLGALHPALAQMLGLYWVDSSVEAGQAYDYLIVGDYEQRFNGYPPGVLRWMKSKDFLGMKAYIVFNKRLGDALPLQVPLEVRGYALPGGIFSGADGVLRDAQNAAGLRWQIRQLSIFGEALLLPNQPVMYHAWRSGLGLADPASPAPASDHKQITRRPLFVTDPRSHNVPQRASDWPPFVLFVQDRGLADGWYSYRVSGIDIFGRTSSLSQPARWFQWSPAPDPAPYYYQMPAGNRAIHPFAVQLLDKLPPPPPTGVEAQALDPEDPYLLRDAAYQTWAGGLSATEKANLIGLRVRWRWPVTHQQQASDTAEFRLYYHPGSAAPTPDVPVPTNWQSRIYVVGFDEYVTVATDGTRVYELFLPTSSDVICDGVPLTPSLTDPVVYANIGVTAVDNKIHTGDHTKWNSGKWGGRTGNEGGMSAPATIYRVLRERPAAPVPPPDAERVFATPADYRSRSYYTYRWHPQSDLKAHIFRALDNSVFQTDWRERPVSISAAKQEIFHPELRGKDPALVARRGEVADELNALNDFPRTLAGKGQAMNHYRSLSNDALRVLAGLPQTSRAFTQLTTEPLNPDHTDNADRRGPDSPANYTPNANLRAYVDTLDGRSSNRYFYRAAYVDAANNRSDLSLSSPPVYLPDVAPPPTPQLLKVLGGERQVSLRWRADRRGKTEAYLVYRTTDKEQGRDIRTMGNPVANIPTPANNDPIEWHDTGLIGGRNYYYRIVALRTGETATETPVIHSEPSKLGWGRAVDQTPPAPPTITTIEWVRISEYGEWHPYNDLSPAGATRLPAVRIVWESTDPNLRSLVQFRTNSVPDFSNASRWLPEGQYEYIHRNEFGFEPQIYRLKVINQAGNINTTFVTAELPTPGGA